MRVSSASLALKSQPQPPAEPEPEPDEDMSLDDTPGQNPDPSGPLVGTPLYMAPSKFAAVCMMPRAISIRSAAFCTSC